MNTQKFISEAFGYKEILPVDITVENKKGKKVPIFGITGKNKPFIKITDCNTNQKCIMCGKVHNKGYYSEKGAKHLIDSFISPTYNWVYKFKSDDNFICEYCGFNSVSYNSPSKSPLGQKMVNVLVEQGKYTYMNFNSDNKNELYGLLKNPPKIPFVILANPPGTVLYNMTFTAEPTISRGMIIVNYGMENLRVKPQEVFQSIEDARDIAEKYKIEASSDHIWNRQNDVSINSPLAYDSDFIKDMSVFLNKYNRDCRIVAKIIFLVYIKNNKRVKKAKTVKTVDTKQKNQINLFDNLY